MLCGSNVMGKQATHFAQSFKRPLRIVEQCRDALGHYKQVLSQLRVRLVGLQERIGIEFPLVRSLGIALYGKPQAVVPFCPQPGARQLILYVVHLAGHPFG